MAATGRTSHPPAVGNPGDVHASALNPAGMLMFDDLGRGHVYLGGAVGVDAEGAVVTYDEVGAVTLIAANAVGPVAVAEAVVPAGSWSWYGVFGAFNCRGVAGIADNGKLGRETTDGSVGDGVLTGDVITGMVARGATVGAGIFLAQLCFPSVNDSSAL